MDPFSYPDNPHVRLHGPEGYKGYESHRDWLRDEFLFRCVYCLRREQWGLLKGQFHVDHFFPKKHRQGLALDYDNLLYCCSSCNLSKGEAEVPNPESELTQDAVNVYEDGNIQARTPAARRIIKKLKLDSAEYVEFRSNLIGIIRLAASYDVDLYLSLMGYPNHLPDLAAKRPQSNSRLQGVNQSCFARRVRGKLPDTYE